MKGYMYILLCSNGKYYTGSTKNLELRLQQHFSGEGSNFTKKYPPEKLMYYEEFQRIDEAFSREKQVQGWSRLKKEALISGAFDKLRHLSRNYTQYGVPQAGTSTDSVIGTSKGTVSGENLVSEPAEDTTTNNNI